MVATSRETMIFYTEVITGKNRGRSLYQVVTIPRITADMNRNNFFYTSTEQFFPEYFAWQDKLHHNVFNNQFSSTLFTSQACKMRLAGDVARMGDRRGVLQGFGGEP